MAADWQRRIVVGLGLSFDKGGKADVGVEVGLGRVHGGKGQLTADELADLCEFIESEGGPLETFLGSIGDKIVDMRGEGCIDGA